MCVFKSHAPAGPADGDDEPVTSFGLNSGNLPWRLVCSADRCLCLMAFGRPSLDQTHRPAGLVLVRHARVQCSDGLATTAILFNFAVHIGGHLPPPAHISDPARMYWPSLSLPRTQSLI